MKHWIFIANDNEWDWRTNQNVGETEPWSAYEDGGKRRKRNFSKVQEGDKIIGYSSGKSKSFVSIGVVEKSLSQDPDKKEITIRKISDLQTPVSLDKVRKIEPFDKKLGYLNTTAIPLTYDEYNILMSIFHDAFLDVYDDVDIVLRSVDMPIEEASKLRPVTAKQTGNSSTWNRDSRISKAALKRTNYICEFATQLDKHESFIADCTKENYVEAHHLIPMKEEGNFDYSLDNALNIVALCSNCHRMIHYSEPSTRKEKITELFEKRKNDLEPYKITLSDLYQMYNV